MTLTETLVRRLLSDRSIEDFDTSLVFRTQLLDNPEAASVLVQIMATEGGEIANRARQMLCLFGEPALRPLADSLSKEEALWRRSVIHTLWAIISASEARDRTALLQPILGSILGLFDDRAIPSVQFSLPIEIEYELRVCDEAFLLCQRLLNSQYHGGLFTGMGFDGRDAEIRALRDQLLGRFA